MVAQDSINIATSGRSTIEVTAKVNSVVHGSGIDTGICNVFIHHTSASLILCENADPSVRVDLESWMSRQVKDGDPMFIHTAEGEDDMSAHIRSILTDCSVTLPVRGGQGLLGTWQGIYLWEHRYEGHQRRLTVTIYGE